MSDTAPSKPGSATAAATPPGAVSGSSTPANNRSITRTSCSTQDKMIGRSVGKARILKRLGRGGMGDVYLAQDSESGAPVVAIFELCDWLTRKGIAHTAPMNKGGSQQIAGLRVTMTNAHHSSGYFDSGQMVYMGEPAGYVIRLEDGMSIYYSGDTCLFGDMKLIGELYKPAIAFLPIGDRFTMDPLQAAKACEFLGVKQVVPMHWGTFPLLTGTPAELKKFVEPRGVQVLELRPGETTE